MSRRTITLLFLAANSSDTARQALDNEVREITSRLRSTEHGRDVHVVQEWAVRAGDLQSHLLRHRPDLVHFAGGASDTGELLLEGEGSLASPVSNEALADTF